MIQNLKKESPNSILVVTVPGQVWPKNSVSMQIKRENDNNYGVQEVYEELNDKGIKVGRSRVQRVMHANGASGLR